MEVISNFETKVALTAKDLSKDIESIDKLLEEKIKTQYEGKCSRNGYVVPNSVKLLSRSAGLIEKGRFTGDILFYAEAESTVLQPPDGYVLEGEVIRKNKMGMYVNHKDAIRVIVPRDLHIGDEEFDNVQVGEIVKVEIKKSRFQVNDTSILSVGVYRGKQSDGEGMAATVREVPVAEKPAFVFATKAKEEEEEKEPEVEEEAEAAPVDETIKFYSTSETFKEFSNFFPAKFTLDGKEYPTVEHYFQAMKFPANPAFQDQIVAAKTPAAAKKLGSTKVIPIRTDWDTIRNEVMAKALRAKFTQNEPLKALLLSTGSKKLEEASPTDSYWGTGKNGKGQNQLGMLLMELRSELQEAAESGDE
jgi:N-glycosidase YbiA